MRRPPYRFAIALLIAAACQGDELPSGPGTSIAPVEQGPAALESDTWYARAKMSAGRAGITAATVQGVVYVIGGHLTTGDAPATDKLESYHPNTSTLLAWRNRAPMPEPRGYTNGAAVISGKIYVSGGYKTDEDGNRLRTNSLFRYDPSTNVWGTRAPMPRATSGGATVAIDGRLYVYVAYGPDNSSGAALYRYNPSTDKWAERAQPPAIQSGAAAVVLGGKMYVIGGREGKAATVATVSVYNPSTNAWTGHVPLITPRAGAVARTIDGRIYVAGGATGASATGIPTEVYDPATGTWSEKAEIPTPRSFAASAGVGGKLYVIGGNGGNGQANEMYVP